MPPKVRCALVVLPALALCRCAAPPPLLTLTRAQTEAVARAESAAAADAIALRAAIASLLEIGRASREYEIEREIVGRYLDASGEPDVDALADDVRQDHPPTALARAVRAGDLTHDSANRWLADYALALRMADGAGVRSALLARLAPMREVQRESDALLAALDERRAAMERVFREARLGSTSIDAWARTPGAIDIARGDDAIHFWRLAIASTIDDPERRAAIEAALEGLFTSPAPLAVR